MIRNAVFCLGLWVALSGSVAAGEADVVAVEFTRNDTGVYRFSVSVLHDDEGWRHYADRWEVVTPQNEVIATRVLAHPHENEQPFTRSLSGVNIPAGMKQVRVRAHCSEHAFGGKEAMVELEGFD